MIDVKAWIDRISLRVCIRYEGIGRGKALKLI